ncbi:MAG: condensation domain-containing protein, partial [Lachnospiraceae bacterium]|nr:condensation domain-containing protein [Lachnospiraceae bacterium]
MDKKLYPLDVGQMLQYLPIRETGTQRCCNISIFSGLQTEIDFDLLKRCIQDEFRRYECLRLRFTAPDENGFVQQYIAERDDRDVPFMDLSNLTMKEADAFLQEKTYEEFNAPEIPMVEITMVRMPEGYNGMYIHIDHRLVDSSGLIVMVNDIMELYCHYRFGSEYPKPLASFEEVLISDLKKAKNEKRRAKDEKFWHDYLTENGEPIYSDIKGSRILQESRKKHGNKSLRAA